MSLITRCPACGTMFKVVTDQLKVSQGWVRCGQCAEVFDAQLHLQTKSNSPAEEALAGAFVVNASTATPVPSGPDDGSYEQDVVAALKTPSAAAQSSISVNQLLASSSAQAEQGGQEPIQASHSDVEPVRDEAAAGALNEISFVRDARRQAFWRKPLVRSSLVLVAIALGCLLGLQLAVHQRDALLVFEPLTKPWLKALCEQLACDVGVPRRIDAIVIDSSSFNKADGVGAYLLGFSLKNTSASVVAMPSLEVSLTDSQDQVAIRRVLSPAQLGVSTGMLAASAEFSNTLTLQVQAGSPPVRIAGYRLLAFYP